MALIVEDGTGKADAESYASTAEADAYFTKLGISTWTGSSTVKENALRVGTQYLDAAYAKRWCGTAADDVQRLNWPRSGAYDGNGWLIENDELPFLLKDACCEAALRALAGTLMPDIVGATGSITAESVKVGPIEKSTSYAAGGKGQTTYYRKIEMLLAPLVTAVNEIRRG